MITPKKLLNNELMKELISIRVDTLWKMIGLKKDGHFPSSNEEGATGKFDNKGAIFIPGGLIFQDVDEMPITYKACGEISSDIFREKVRSAMRYDNATLLYPDGIAAGINLDSGFFSKAARRIYTFKKAAYRRKRKIRSPKNINVSADDIILSHCPTYMSQPYGARTRISTCVSVGFIDPPLFFSYCETQLNLYGDLADNYAKRVDLAQSPAITENGTVLYPPCIVVCHDTRYKNNSLTGLTRLLGIGKFGEFATFTLEQVNNSLINELKRKNKKFTSNEFFVSIDDTRILGILRIYSPTNLGKRSKRYSLNIVSPVKDLDLNLARIAKEAKKRYYLTG